VPAFLLMRLLIAATVVLMVGGVWAAGRIERSTDAKTERALVANRELMVAMLDQETGLEGYANTRSREFLEPYDEGRRAFERALAAAQASIKDATDRRFVQSQDRIGHAWQERAQRRVDEVRRERRGTDLGSALERKSIMDSFRRANAGGIAYLRGRREDERDRSRMIAIGLVSGLGIIFALLGYALVERPARHEAGARKRLAEFSDAMQVTRDEQEAYGVLRRHLERWLTAAQAWVFTRNASANRLMAATPVEPASPLAQPLADAEPETCLAIRLAKPHLRSPGEEPLMTCSICGTLPGCSSCIPSIVGGEVVGAVLVETPKALPPAELANVTATVAGAGPVIANLRNLSIAELRAATDALTGLPNQRSVQEALRRMAAQATRTKAPLAAAVMDLDRFKQVNDVYGHGKGDEVLSTIGAVLRDGIRESDFAGRHGGEEFVILLPDTDGPGAITVAEKLRATIEDLKIPLLEGRVSASFGIAVLPTHALDPEQLLRAADRALYAAKNGGRNRVEVVAAS